MAGAAACDPDRSDPDGVAGLGQGPAEPTVGRGLLIGLPLALIFAVLFASADPIFRRAMTIPRPADRSRDAAGAGPVRPRLCLARGGPAVAGGRRDPGGSALLARGRGEVAADRGAGGRLGASEALVILLVIDLVVGLFVGLQLAYLFGGLTRCRRRDDVQRLRAARVLRARRGGVPGRRRGGRPRDDRARRSRPYLVALLALLGLSAVVLVSAAMRLRLYQDAYGWTELRLYVLVTIVSLAAALVVTAGLVVANRTRWLGHGLAVIGVVALVGLNLIAPSAFVAEQNLARVLDPALVPPGGQADSTARTSVSCPTTPSRPSWRHSRDCRPGTAGRPGPGPARARTRDRSGLCRLGLLEPGS